MEKAGTKGAIRFLVKSLKGNTIDLPKSLFTSYLFNILVNDSRSLVKVCELLISQKASLNITENDIGRIEQQLRYHIENNNDLETIWLLYLRFKLTKKYLKADISNIIINSNNDLAKIVLLEELKNKLSDRAKKLLIEKANSWILNYHLFYNGLIDENKFSQKSGIKHNIAFYKKLKRNKFRFYET